MEYHGGRYDGSQYCFEDRYEGSFYGRELRRGIGPVCQSRQGMSSQSRCFVEGQQPVRGHPSEVPNPREHL